MKVKGNPKCTSANPSSPSGAQNKDFGAARVCGKRFLYGILGFGSAKSGTRAIFARSPYSRSSYFAPSSETQGQIVGARESLNGRKNMARRNACYAG